MKFLYTRKKKQHFSVQSLTLTGNEIATTVPFSKVISLLCIYLTQSQFRDKYRKHLQNEDTEHDKAHICSIQILAWHLMRLAQQ